MYFGIIKMYLRFLGILEMESSSFLGRPVVAKFYRMFIISTFLYLLIPMTCFIVFEAERFEDCAEALTDIITTNAAFTLFLCLLIEKENFIQLFNDLRALVDTSELLKQS